MANTPNLDLGKCKCEPLITLNYAYNQISVRNNSKNK